jgi:hypothetical protein
MYIAYELHQATQTKTARQQREEDAHLGELAADLGRLWNSIAHPRHGGFRDAPEIEMLTEAPAACACSPAER